MIEKRFTFSYKGITDELTNTHYGFRENDIGVGKLCDLLNALNDENKQLESFQKKVLQRHLDYWRGVYNPIDESLVVEMNVIKDIAEDLGVELDDWKI